MWEPQDGERDWERAGCRLGSHVLPSSGCADRSQALLTVSSEEGRGCRSVGNPQILGGRRKHGCVYPLLSPPETDGRSKLR